MRRSNSLQAMWCQSKPAVRWIGSILGMLGILGIFICGTSIGLASFTKPQPVSWSRAFATPIAGTLIVNNRMYATDQSGGFWQIDVNTGKTRAYIHLGLATTYQPFAINEQLVGFVSNKGAVIAIDTESFSEKWRIETEELAEPELPQVDRNFIYFADRNQMVYVADSATGKLLWKKSFSSSKEERVFAEIKPVEYTPFYTDETSLYVGNRTSNQLTRCQLLTGECQLIRSNYDPNHQTMSIGNNILTFTNTNQEYELVELTSLKTLLQLHLSAPPINRAETTIFSTGKKVFQFSLTEHKQLTEISLLNQVQSIISLDNDHIIGLEHRSQHASNIFMAELNSSSIQWQTTLSGKCQPPSAFAEITVVPCQNLLYGLESKTGAILWQLPLLGSVEQVLPADSSQTSELLVVQTQTTAQSNLLYGVEKTTGRVAWQSPLISVVKNSLRSTQHGASVLVNQGKVLLTFTDTIPQNFEWPVAMRTTGIHELVENKRQGTTDSCPLPTAAQLTGKMRLLQIKNQIINFISPHPLTVSEIATSPAIILEIRGADITSVSARFWQNHQVVEQRDGFPVRKEIHQVRFLPPATGTWFWEIEVKTKFQKQILKGISKNISSSQQNKLTITNQQWQRGGVPFFGIGWQTCMLDYDFDGIWTDHWPLNNSASLQMNADTVVAVDAATYIQSMQKAGFNLMRLSLENCSPRLTQCLNRTDILINQQMSAAVDAVLIEAKRNQMAVVFGIFGFEPWLSGVTKGKLAPTLTKYLDYVIARYGAYVDVWELANESTPDNEWAIAVSNYLKTHDPYQHSVTISWERPDLTAIDSTQLHYYDSEPLSEITRRFLPIITQAQQWHKPVMIGEAGNATVNSDQNSLIRFTHKNWMSMFTHTPIIWWDQPDRLYYHPTSANIFLGPAEKRVVAFSQDFIQSYLQSPNQRFFVLTDVEHQPQWLGIETDHQVFLYAADPFTTQNNSRIDLIPTNLEISQLVLPLSGTVVPIKQLQTVQNLIANSQPYVLVFNR